MKKFRSSKQLNPHKNLSPINHYPSTQNHSKEEHAHLKLKIKALEEQVELLKKSNLNIFIPISEKQFPEKQNQENKDEIIKKLRLEILSLKGNVKRLEREKQSLKSTYEAKISELKNQISEVKAQVHQLREQLTEAKEEIYELESSLEEESKQKQAFERELIELRVEARFLREDLESYKQKYENEHKKFTQLQSLVLNVEFNSKINKSATTKITAIESSELQKLRLTISQLEAKVQELLYRLSNPVKQSPEKVRTLNIDTKNIGEQIVRLKRNIDLQLGIKGDQQVTEQFMSKYRETDDKFKELLNGCKWSGERSTRQPNSSEKLRASRKRIDSKKTLPNV